MLSMRKERQEILEENPYNQRTRFNQKHNIYTRVCGLSVGAAVINVFVMIVKITPEEINKAITNGSHSLFTAGNNSLAIGLAAEAVTALISGKTSSTYGKSVAEIDGAIASHQLSINIEPENPGTDI